MVNKNLDNVVFSPLCVFCSAPWSPDNVRVHDVYSSGGCDTCGHGASVSATIDITCHSCGRIMYQKEYRN